MPPDSGLACYADDTLVLVWGAEWDGIVRLAELAVTRMVAAIKGLGLTVSPEKSEAMWFCRRADHGTPPAGYRLRLEGAEIEVGNSMKDLGLTLDSLWTFRAHFERLAPTVEATANALGRLLLRLDGPGVGMRRLTPAWCDRGSSMEPDLGRGLDGQPPQSPEGQEVAQDGGHQGSKRLPHHCRGSSGNARRVPPFEKQALRCREIYLHRRALSDGVQSVGDDVEGRARRALLDRWRVSLDMREGATGTKGSRGRPSKVGRLLG